MLPGRGVYNGSPASNNSMHPTRINAALDIKGIRGRVMPGIMLLMNTTSLMLTGRRAHPLTEYLTDAKSETAEADT
jgi:hypothetical protein